MYGIAGGQVIQDAFGNPLGTTYLKGCDENGQPDGDPTTNFGCFDPDGAPIILVEGDGTIQPNADGTLLVENLVPGKYGIIVSGPAGENWIQTSTIEGSKVIDAWVASDEPPFFVEFGPPGHHVFVGFTQETQPSADNPDNPLPTTPHSISGQIRNNHMSRPPNFAFYAGNPFPDCYVALLPGQGGGIGTATHVQACADDSSFVMSDVAEGNHTMVVFDAALNVVIAQFGVHAGPDIAAGGPDPWPTNPGDVDQIRT